MSDRDDVQDESLSGQRLRLASLEDCEARIRTLRERECDLEVEHMAAEAALQSAARHVRHDIDSALAVRIGRVLERRRADEQREPDHHEERGLRSSGTARERDKLRAGSAALRSWLDASQPREPAPAAGAAKIALLIVTIATLWAAYAIHPAFLLLLAVVVGPLSFAMGRGHDSEWQRVGARRRFSASGLAELGEWNEEHVRRRLAELEALLARSSSGGTTPPGAYPSDGAADEGSENGALANDEEQFASDLAAAGLTLEDLRGDTGEWLRLAARAEHRRESLERVKSERAHLREQAAELRDHLLRYLHSQGVRPTQLPDTTAAISEDLERLSDAS